MEIEIQLSPKGQRTISSFVGKELLYDYVIENLDEERKKAMDTYIQSSKESREEIKRMRNALSYIQMLAKTEVGESLLEQARTPVSYTQGFFKKIRFNEWPTGLKLGIEVLLITSIVMVLSIFVPWHRISQLHLLNRDDITLAEVQSDFATPLTSETEIQEKQLADSPETVFVDEALPAATPMATAATLEIPKGAKVSEDSKISNSAKTSAEVKTPTQASSKAAVAVIPALPKVATPPISTVVPSGSGWLYRGNLQVVNLNATTEKIISKISEFGGRKAGEVELGWKKGNGRYFHFTIPESKYEELSHYLLEVGNFKISQERHERVMPEGILRVIFTVTEAPVKENKLPKTEVPAKSEVPIKNEAETP